MTASATRSTGLRMAAGVAVVFGGPTVFPGGQALFGEAAALASAGNGMPFVVWFKALPGFAYVLAGIGISGAVGPIDAHPGARRSGSRLRSICAGPGKSGQTDQSQGQPLFAPVWWDWCSSRNRRCP